MKLGVTPTLWWNDDFPPSTPASPSASAVSEMALAGFQGCSIGHKYPTDTAVLKAALDLRGLRVSEPWTSTYFTIDRHGAADDRALPGDAGPSSRPWAGPSWSWPSSAASVAPAAGGACSPTARSSTTPSGTRLTSGLNQLGKIAAGEGMRLCYHHHMGTGVMTRAEIDRLMASTDPELVHLLLDTGHIGVRRRRPAGPGPGLRRPHRPRPPQERPPRGRERVARGGPVVPGGRSRPASSPCPATARSTSGRSSTRWPPPAYEGWLVVEAEQDPNKADPLEYAMKARAYLARRPRLVTMNARLGRDVFFSFFMFTADLRPEDAEYSAGDSSVT